MAAFLAAAALLAAAPLQPPPYYARIARRLADKLPREHLTHQPVDEAVSARTWTNYLASLDYERVYFLASDIAKFRIEETRLGGKLSEGDLAFAFEVYAVFLERVRNRYVQVGKLLEQGFDPSADETVEINRKDAAWPRDEADWNEIWRKKIKNEYIQRLVARDMAEKPAKPEADGGAGGGGAKAPADAIRSRYKQFLTVLEDSDAEWVLQKYLTALTHAYDPHSDYMSPSVLEDFNIEMKLSLVGIGALLSSEDGAAKVVRVIPGGPAHRDKREIRLVPGDKIVAVGEGAAPPVDVLHLPLREIVKKIRGQKGSTVVLVVIPASDATGSTTKKVDLVRDEVKLEDQAVKHRVESAAGNDGVTRKLGILTLPGFYSDIRSRGGDASDIRSSSKDVEQALAELKSQGVEGVILDLRNNGGGYLPEAVTMTGLFIGQGPVVQVAEGMSGSGSSSVLSDRDPAVAYSGPLLVLVNRFSASASEILAGALQDYGRAVIVGDSKTHGKGTVQSILDLSRDAKLGSLKVTSAMYYRVTGSSTQLKGIHPDIVISSPFDKMEFGEDFLPNALGWCNTNAVPFFSPAVALGPVLTALKERSEKRRAADPAFTAYAKVLSEIESINKMKELPLNLAKRKELAKNEKDLYDLQKSFVPEDAAEGPEAKDKKSAPDMVLKESLKILADLATLQKSQPEAAAAATAPRTAARKGVWQSLKDAVTDWFSR